MNRSENLSIIKQFRECVKSSNDAPKCMKNAMLKELKARFAEREVKTLDSKGLPSCLFEMLYDALMETQALEDRV